MLGQWRGGHANTRITTNSDGFHLGDSKPLTNGVWHHLATTYDSNARSDNFKLYVDGVLVGARVAAATIPTVELDIQEVTGAPGESVTVPVNIKADDLGVA